MKRLRRPPLISGAQVQTRDKLVEAPPLSKGWMIPEEGKGGLQPLIDPLNTQGQPEQQKVKPADIGMIYTQLKE
ncbi:MAG: hypothetical protein ACPGC9_01490 [Cytophagales bacterium]